MTTGIEESTGIPLQGVRVFAATNPLPKAGGPVEGVYRIYDNAGTLLYVGRSVQVGGRLEQHAKTKPWWHLVTDVAISYEYRHGSAQLDEYDAILNEFPVFNIDGVPWRKIRLSKRPVEMDRMQNRALIVGAASQMGMRGVVGRLDVLREVEPDVYTRFANDPRRWDFRFGDEEVERAILVLAEERYFEAFAELHRGPYPLHLRRQRIIVDEQNNILRVEPARLPPASGQES